MKLRNFQIQVKNILPFLIVQLITVIVILPLLVFYGPFSNVQRTVVGASINSLKHGYIARLFLSNERISQIITDSGYNSISTKNSGIQVKEYQKQTENHVKLLDINGLDYKGKLLIIKDPYSIRVGYSSNIPTTGETTSSIAEKAGAIAAINAGGFKDFAYAGTGGVPIGFIMHKGKVIFNDYKNEKKLQDCVAFTKEGMLIVGMHSIEKLKEYGVVEAVSFGPPLIVNGKPTIEKGDGGWGIAPRTAIGQKENGEVVMLVIDGRSIHSIGATLKDVQDILIANSVVNAANLDGGSSTTMYLNGKVINRPADTLGQRAIPSTFMVVPGGEGEQ